MAGIPTPQEWKDLGWDVPLTAEEAQANATAKTRRVYDKPPSMEELRQAGLGGPVAKVEWQKYQASKQQALAAQDEMTAEQRRARTERARQNETAPLGLRALVGLKGNLTGKLNLLRERGYQPFVDNGNIGYIDDQGEPHMLEKNWILTPKELAGDVLDNGYAIERFLPGLVVGLAAGKVPGASPLKTMGKQALADLGGEALAQGVSAALPGKEDVRPMERLVDAGANVVGGALPTAAMMGGKAALKVVGPATSYEASIGRTLRGQQAPEAVRAAVDQGLALEQRTGLPPLSAAGLAKTDAGLGLEHTLRKSPVGSQVVSEFDAQRHDAMYELALRKVRELADGTAKNPADALRASANAWNASVERLHKGLSASAEAKANAIALSTKNQPVIPIDNTLKKLDELAQQYPVEGQSGEQLAAGAFIRDFRAKLLAMHKPPEPPATTVLDYLGRPIVREAAPAEPPKMTFRELNGALSGFMNGARGKGIAIDNIGPGRLQQGLSGKILSALRKDLDAAADAGGKLGTAGEAIKDFRDSYKAGMDKIRAQQSILLRAAFKADAEGKDLLTVARGLVSGGRNEELRRGLALADKSAPEEANNLRSSLLEGLLSESTARGQQGFGATQSLMTILNNQHKRDTMEAIMSNVPSGKRDAFFAALDDIKEYGSRAARQGTTAGGSPTDPFKRMNAVLGGVPVVSGIVKLAKEKLVKLSNPKTLAEKLNDPQGRMEILGLVKVGATGDAQEIARTLAQMSITGTVDAIEESK